MIDLEASKERLKLAITADIRTAGGFLVVGKALADAADAYGEIGSLRAEVERLTAEDPKAVRVRLLVPVPTDPFNSETCDVVDYSYSERVYVVKCDVIERMSDQADLAAGLQAEVERLRALLERTSRIVWKIPGGSDNSTGIGELVEAIDRELAK